jgi:hypothetical protein
VPIVQFLKKRNDNPKSSGCHGTQTKTPQPQVGRPLATVEKNFSGKRRLAWQYAPVFAELAFLPFEMR